MSDQQAPAAPDTPAVAGPEQAPGTQEQQQVTADPYEKRYNDLRPEFDRATQERAELQQWKEWAELALTTDDTDTQRQALQRLGFDVPDEVEDVEPTEWLDETAQDPRLDELLAWKEQQEQQAREAAGFEFLTTHINSEVDRLGMDQLDDGTRQWILSRALANPGIPAPPGSPHDELPNVEAAFKEFQQWETERQKQWAQTKRSAPYVPPGGQPANEVPNTGTGHEARMDRAMRALYESEQ